MKKILNVFLVDFAWICFAVAMVFKRSNDLH
jgi:hypothetical protein